jgi:hypothetical protein
MDIGKKKQKQLNTPRMLSCGAIKIKKCVSANNGNHIFLRAKTLLRPSTKIYFLMF